MNKETLRPPISPNRYGYHTVSFEYMYRFYSKIYKNRDVPEYSVIREAFEKIMEKVWEHVIIDTWVCKFPYGFGQVYVYEVESSSNKITKYPDWKESKKRGKRVWKYNLHSGGIRHRIYWDTVLCKLKNHKFYKLEFYRGPGDKPLGYRGINYWIRRCNETPELPLYRSNIK